MSKFLINFAECRANRVGRFRHGSGNRSYIIVEQLNFFAKK